jgi:hypothetical protein
VFVLLLIPAMLGTVVHYPAYVIGDYLATQLSRESEDVVSTIKIISAMLLFPLTWLTVALLIYKATGLVLALVSCVIVPALGYIAIRFFEELDKFVGGLRALAFFLMRRRFFVRLLAERNAIRGEILALGEEAAIATE